jgi:hypothetical protein
MKLTFKSAEVMPQTGQELFPKYDRQEGIRDREGELFRLA